MKHLFIINPEAGKGRALEYKDKIEKIFTKINEEYEIIITERVGHATEVVRELTSRDRYRVYAIGGDGTLNEVVNGLVGTDSILGVIPAGSGNDFIRSIWDEQDDELLIKTIRGDFKKIDLAKVNNKYFINISSIGFDAEVVYNARKYKKYKFISGPFAYFISIFITALRFKGVEIEFELDGQPINDKIFLMAVANGKYYGGGIKIAPFANITDGALELYLIKAISIFKLIREIPKVLKGVHSYGIKEVKYSKIQNIKAKSKNEFTINIDGEIVRGKEVEFLILPSKLDMIIPNN
ncbi:diacylglycerol/lipid kinase family protein [Clostridium sp. 'White wine YQ']|uniref:diacylglycerol/lipid kinase family protein n=1 Tax=Clostridium sp. 'White wine YQ' TaxID=3027474 RepID=UPI0023673886|nr:diacylglycerol kinase family protein [Clostridium sp. 'White wine YQ']MDD7792635.1 diacylglycerol kinase family lipid kinase [Clostridium sp. 'White wine YQ']